MNHENIVSLSNLLVAAGFDASIAQRLLQQICFRPSGFTLSGRFLKEGGWLTCTIYFEREEDLYSCRYYDASFLKAIEVPDRVIQSVNIKELDQKMESIVWNMEEERGAGFDPVNELNYQTELQIENAISELLKLTESPDGKYFADYLKLKHWSGIDSLTARNNLNSILAKYEISQRFYFPDGKGISIEEAYRFLLNRWLEKKLKSREKRRTENADRGVYSGGAPDKSLPQKKRKEKVQKINR